MELSGTAPGVLHDSTTSPCYSVPANILSLYSACSEQLSRSFFQTTIVLVTFHVHSLSTLRSLSFSRSFRSLQRYKTSGLAPAFTQSFFDPQSGIHSLCDPDHLVSLTLRILHSFTHVAKRRNTEPTLLESLEVIRPSTATQKTTAG